MQQIYLIMLINVLILQQNCKREMNGVRFEHLSCRFQLWLPLKYQDRESGAK